MDAPTAAALGSLFFAGYAATLQTIQTYFNDFQRENADTLLKGLADDRLNLDVLVEREDLRRYFFSIIHKAADEANKEKIRCWQNAVMHLVTDFRDFDFKDNFVRVLEDLTPFDLTVLHKIYTTDFEKPYVEKALLAFFEEKGVLREITMQSIKRLASHALVTECVDSSGRFGGEDDEPYLEPTYFIKNELGPLFFRFVSKQ